MEYGVKTKKQYGEAKVIVISTSLEPSTSIAKRDENHIDRDLFLAVMKVSWEWREWGDSRWSKNMWAKGIGRPVMIWVKEKLWTIWETLSSDERTITWIMNTRENYHKS